MEQNKDKNWSISFEHEEYVDDLDLLLNDAVEAVRVTNSGFYVNIVTPERFGNPEEFLADFLYATFQETIHIQYIDQCGCGGYVLRVWKNS